MLYVLRLYDNLTLRKLKILKMTWSISLKKNKAKITVFKGHNREKMPINNNIDDNEENDNAETYQPLNRRCKCHRWPSPWWQGCRTRRRRTSWCRSRSWTPMENFYDEKYNTTLNAGNGTSYLSARCTH